ncbi:MAG: polysaccharide deacetylase family protein [Myxococcaceae bacterium]
MKGPAVGQLQGALNKLGFLTAAQVDGDFGPITHNAVVKFQKAKSLVADGVYGPKTRAALEKALQGAEPQPPPAPKPPPTQPDSVLRGLFYSDKFVGRAALTFDDGPHPVNTPKVLDILKQFNVKATFFVTGQNAEKYPELVKRIVKEGHTLGNHSWDHKDLATLNSAQVKTDLARVQTAVDKALGHHYELEQFRPPYGSMDAEVKEVARKNADAAVLWNVDSNDWRYKNDDKKILANVFEGASSIYARGGVILFHDIHPQTVRVLDDVIARLQRENFKIEKSDKFLERKYGGVA